MKTSDAPGPRIDAAKKAATALIGSLPAGTPLTLMTYGTHTGSADADKAKGCQDVSTLVDRSVLSSDWSAATTAVQGISPSGYTPIGLALTKAAAVVGDVAGSVVLVSDGQDTCAPPDPCKTAASIAAAHPKLSISTVGFRTDAAASKQLSCIAGTTNGLFVTAANTNQLVKRLAATQDTSARTKVTSTGVGSIQLGQSYDAIAGANSGFPGWASGTSFKGSLSGVTGTLTIIVWRDCSYVFGPDRKLVGIQPQAGTIDDVTAGSAPAAVRSAYGTPVSSVKNPDGTYTVLYQADSASGSMYQVIYSGDPAAGGTVVKVIYLCTCKAAVTKPVMFSPTQVGDLKLPASESQGLPVLRAMFGRPPTREVVDQCPLADSILLKYPDITLRGSYDSNTKQGTIDGWDVGPKPAVPVVLPYGIRIGASISDVLAVPGASVDDMTGQSNFNTSPGSSWVSTPGSPGLLWYFKDGSLQSVGTLNLIICAD